MRYTEWQDLFSSFSFMFIFGRDRSGSEVWAAGLSAAEVCVKSSPDATK
jgi:hypothetical protein